MTNCTVTTHFFEDSHGSDMGLDVWGAQLTQGLIVSYGPQILQRTLGAVQTAWPRIQDITVTILSSVIMPTPFAIFLSRFPSFAEAVPSDSAHSCLNPAASVLSLEQVYQEALMWVENKKYHKAISILHDCLFTTRRTNENLSLFGDICVVLAKCEESLGMDDLDEVDWRYQNAYVYRTHALEIHLQMPENNEALAEDHDTLGFYARQRLDYKLAIDHFLIAQLYTPIPQTDEAARRLARLIERTSEARAQLGDHDKA